MTTAAANSVGFKDGDQVYVSLKIKSGDGTTAKDLNVMANHLIDMNIKQTRGGAYEATIRLYDESFDSLEDVIFNSGVLNNDPNRQGQSGQPVLKFSFGWANGDKSQEWDLTVHSYSSRYSLGKGTELELKCIGGAAYGLFNRGTHWFNPGIAIGSGNQARSGDTVRSVVETFANEDDLLVDVEDGDLLHSARQNGKTGIQFLQWLAGNGQFRNSSGNVNYQVYVRPGAPKPTLVCRTGGQPPPTANTWNYLYGRDAGGQVKDWEVDIQSASLFSLGAAGMKAAIVNKGDKSTGYCVVNSRTVTGVAGEGNIVPAATQYPAPLRLAFEDEATARAYAADKWQRLNTTNVRGRLTVIGNPLIQPDDLINVLVITGENGISDIRDLHPTSGSYNILSVENNITLGDYTTTIECVRNGNLTVGAGGDQQSTGTATSREQLLGAALVLLNSGTAAGDVQPTLITTAINFRSAYGSGSRDTTNGFVNSIVARVEGGQ